MAWIIRRHSSVGASVDRAEQHHARVVDEHVQAAELGVRALHERPRLLLLADVGGDGERPAAVLLDALGERSMRSLRRAASATAAPASAQASAVASPIPDEAPVTATTRPQRSMSMRRA